MAVKSSTRKPMKPEATPQSILPSMRTAIMLAVLVMIAGGAYVFYTLYTAPATQPAPDFEMPVLGGSGTLSPADFKGQVLVMNIWGSWCAPCRDEAPLLQATYERYFAQDVQFLGVAVSDEEEDARAFIREFNISYPNVLDYEHKMQTEHNIYGVPVTVIIDRDGNIFKTFFSRPDESDLQTAIEQALDT